MSWAHFLWLGKLLPYLSIAPVVSQIYLNIPGDNDIIQILENEWY